MKLIVINLGDEIDDSPSELRDMEAKRMMRVTRHWLFHYYIWVVLCESVKTLSTIIAALRTRIR
jgi:hypothetical protein